MNSTDSNSRILFTASVDEKYREKLESLHVDVDVIPFIEAEFPKPDSWLNNLKQGYDAWVFTSKRAVKAIEPVLADIPVPPFVFAVGKKTAEYLQKLSINSIIPEDDYNLKSLSDKMNRYKLQHVVHFCGNRKAGELDEMLTIEGVDVHSVEVYQTRLMSQKVDTDFYDAFVFMSPSAVKAFYQENILPASAVVFAIGPATQNALQKQGIENVVLPEVSSVDSLINKIKDFFQNVLSRS